MPLVIAVHCALVYINPGGYRHLLKQLIDCVLNTGITLGQWLNMQGQRTAFVSVRAQMYFQWSVLTVY